MFILEARQEKSGFFNEMKNKGNNIILVGFMGCGKTTLGKKLANRLAYDFIDTDQYIQEVEKRKIMNIFALQGEEYFRKIEHETILKLSFVEKSIISVGGGLPCYQNNMKILLQMGTVIYLQRPAKELYQRLMQSQNDRPLLKNKTVGMLSDYIEYTLKEREVFYRQADLILDREHQHIEGIIQVLGSDILSK